MPGKSRRRKGKYSPPKKRKKERISHQAVLTEQPVLTPAQKPVSSTGLSTPAASIPEPVIIRHPYVSSELRTIGILAGIMLIILIVLAVVLS